MYVFVVSYIECRVLHCAVSVTVEADDITYLDLVLGNFPALSGLARSAVRQRDSIVCVVAVHNETGAVEALRRR